MEMDSILAGLEIEENKLEIVDCQKNENNKKFEQNNLDDDFPSNSGEELSKLFSKICELNGKKEKLEEICPNLILAIRKYFQYPKGAIAQGSQCSASILSQSFGICGELAKIEGSKLVRKSASAALRILVGAKNEQNERKRKSSKSEMGIWDAFLTLLDGLEEPQYHLVLPMLPKFEILIKFVAQQPFSNSPSPADQFSWPWLRLLLEKAINHPNGWIRIWALQRTVKMPKELHRDSAFILFSILPAMNGLDPFWRLAVRGELDNFIGQLGQMLENSLEWCSSNEKVDFIISLLELISNPTKLWTACPLYFLSKSLNFEVQERNIFPENAEFDPNWRRLFLRIADIPHISLRIATNLNFLKFFIQLHFWKNDSSQKFAYFLAMNLLERGLAKEEYGKMIGRGIGLFCEENSIVGKFDEILEKFEEIYSANNLKDEKMNFLELIPSNSDHQSALECIKNLCEFILETSNFESICENLQKIEKMLGELEISKLDSNEFGDFLANLIHRLYRQCNEQRKSRNFLPNLKYFLRICFHKKIFEFAKKNEEKENELMEIIQGKFEDLFCQSQLNTSVGLLLARQMFDGHIYLKGEEWAEKLIELATFGPVIKRECRILCLAYQQIYDEAENGGAFLPMEEINLLHLCAHQCRLLAIKTICAILGKSTGQNDEFAKAIFIGIFKKFDQFNKTKSSSYGLSMAHRLKTRLAQLLVLILDFANSKEMVNSIFDNSVVNLLDPGQQYSIKLLFEWILLKILAKFPEFLPKFLELEKKFMEERIGSISSWLNIFHHFLAQNDSIDHLRIFFSRILPWSTSQNFSIRCTALAALRLAWNRNFPKLQDLPEFSIISNLAKFDLAISTGNSTRIINSLCDDFYFAHFHPIRHFSLQTIFQIFPAKTGMPEDEIISTKLLMSNFEENFANEFGQRNLPILCADQKFVEAPSLIYSNFEKKKEKIMEEKENSKNELEGEELGEVQRKLNIFEGNEENIGDKPELIVCATLINKTANLGGLCRTCEIFNVRSLCISNKMLVESVDFKALSLNAENWLHIEQVKSKDLFEYLRQKREQEGFQCIAAEQTTKSVPLENFQFPRRSILLLGDEKEGIPVELFGQVDCTVEITQLGKTRSLNVHVSAALCIHQFAAQFLMKRGK